MYGIQTRAIPVQVECDDTIGGPFAQSRVQASSRVTNPRRHFPPDPDWGKRFFEYSPDSSCGRSFIWPQPRHVNASESQSPRLAGPPSRWMIASASFLMPCESRRADPMFLQIRSIRPLPGRSLREKEPEAGACDATMANLRISHTRSRSSTSIMDCICLLNCLLPFMPLIIFRLLFH